MALALTGCDVVLGLEDREPERPGQCGDAFGGTPYALELAPRSWLDAEARCEALDRPGDGWFSHLAVLSSRTEIAELALPVGSEVWSGLVSPDLGAFTWVTAEPADMPWGEGKPSSDSEDRCGAIEESSLSLDDTSCSNMLPFVCECDRFPAVPGTYTGRI